MLGFIVLIIICHQVVKRRKKVNEIVDLRQEDDMKKEE